MTIKVRTTNEVWAPCQARGNEDCRNLNSLSSGGAMPPATRRQPQLVVLVVPLRHPVADA